MNLPTAHATDGVGSVLNRDVDDAVDPHLERIKNEVIGNDSDEEVMLLIRYLSANIVWILLDLLLEHAEILLQDEDFVADKDDEGSPTDDSGEGESDASKSGEEKEVNFLLRRLRFNVVSECHFNR